MTRLGPFLRRFLGDSVNNRVASKEDDRIDRTLITGRQICPEAINSRESVVRRKVLVRSKFLP